MHFVLFCFLFGVKQYCDCLFADQTIIITYIHKHISHTHTHTINNFALFPFVFIVFLRSFIFRRILHLADIDFFLYKKLPAQFIGSSKWECYWLVKSRRWQAFRLNFRQLRTQAHAQTFCDVTVQNHPGHSKTISSFRVDFSFTPNIFW